jgi:hypothetical protein
VPTSPSNKAGARSNSHAAQYGDILRGQVEKSPPLIERAGISLN